MLPWISAPPGSFQPAGGRETSGKTRAIVRPKPTAITEHSAEGFDRELHSSNRANISPRSDTGVVCSPNPSRPTSRGPLPGVPLIRQRTVHRPSRRARLRAADLPTREIRGRAIEPLPQSRGREQRLALRCGSARGRLARIRSLSSLQRTSQQ